MEFGWGVCVGWRRGRLHFSEGVVVLRKVVPPVCVQSYFIVVIKGEGAIWCSRHVGIVGKRRFAGIFTIVYEQVVKGRLGRKLRRRIRATLVFEGR